VAEEQGETEATEPVVYEDLMAALEASLAAVKRGRGEGSSGRFRATVHPPRAATVPRWYESTAIDLPGTGAAFRVVFIPPTPGDQALWEIGEFRDRPPALVAAANLGITRTSVISETDVLYRALLAVHPDLSATYTPRRVPGR
jgi:hypothetical protein